MFLRCESGEPRMSLVGHSRRFRDFPDESGLPPTADVLRHRSEPTRWANSRHASRAPVIDAYLRAAADASKSCVI